MEDSDKNEDRTDITRREFVAGGSVGILTGLSGCLSSFQDFSQYLSSTIRNAPTRTLVRERAFIKPTSQGDAINEVKDGAKTGLIGSKTYNVLSGAVYNQEVVRGRVPNTNPLLFFDGFQYDGEIYGLNSSSNYVESTKLTSSEAQPPYQYSEDKIKNISDYSDFGQQAMRKAIDRGEYTTKVTDYDSKGGELYRTLRTSRHVIGQYGTYTLVRDADGTVYKVLFEKGSSKFISYLEADPSATPSGKVIEVEFTIEDISEETLQTFREAIGLTPRGTFSYTRLKHPRNDFSSEFKKYVRKTKYMTVDQGMYELRFK